MQLRCQTADLLDAAAAGDLPAVVVRHGHRGEPGVLHHVTRWFLAFITAGCCYCACCHQHFPLPGLRFNFSSADGLLGNRNNPTLVGAIRVRCVKLNFVLGLVLVVALCHLGCCAVYVCHHALNFVSIFFFLEKFVTLMYSFHVICSSLYEFHSCCDRCKLVPLGCSQLCNSLAADEL